MKKFFLVVSILISVVCILALVLVVKTYNQTQILSSQLEQLKNSIDSISFPMPVIETQTVDTSTIENKLTMIEQSVDTSLIERRLTVIEQTLEDFNPLIITRDLQDLKTSTDTQLKDIKKQLNTIFFFGN